MTDVDRARALRRRHVHERQAVIFGVLLAGLAVAGLGATAVFTGSVDLPFIARGFSTPPPEPEPEAGYCPPAGALPVAYGQVTVNVLNGTSQAGLAGATASGLTERGFAVASSTNAEDPYSGAARISFGLTNAAAAFTLAAHLEEVDMVPAAREDGVIDLTLGADYIALKPVEQVLLDPALPLVGAEGCRPLDEATPAGETPAPQG